MLRVLPLSLLLMVVVDTGSAAGFGTVRDSIVLGQNAEHEMITRRALSCTARSSADCFESRSLLSLAGGPGTFGAVGEPDMVPAAPAPAHCDDADYVAGTYSRTRRQATNQLRACWKHLRERFRQGIREADLMLGAGDRINAGEVAPAQACTASGGRADHAKCRTLLELGRALHGVQDFYSHSNWADEAAPGVPIGPENPPGLDHSGLAAVVSLRTASMATPPLDLATGCFCDV